MGKEDIQIDSEETTGENTGENAFKSEIAPDVCAVVVDKNSGRGFVEVAGGGFADQIEKTGPEETGYIVLNIRHNQGCMIYGCSTVLYIRPRSYVLRSEG